MGCKITIDTVIAVPLAGGVPLSRAFELTDPGFGAIYRECTGPTEANRRRRSRPLGGTVWIKLECCQKYLPNTVHDGRTSLDSMLLRSRQDLMSACSSRPFNASRIHGRPCASRK
jgi:hypothetical protein